MYVSENSNKLPKPLSLKEIHRKTLHAIGGEWYMNKLNENIHPLNKLKLSKILQEKEVEI